MATKVLESDQATSRVWAGGSGDYYILLNLHAGGAWELQELIPDGDIQKPADWVNISPSDSGFESSGGWWFKSRADTRYRLHGGNIGAEAWVTNPNNLGVQVL